MKHVLVRLAMFAIGMPGIGMLAIPSRAQSQLTCSTFDTGLDGWTEDEATCRNVGGAADCTDRSGGSNLVAPAQFHGNWVERVRGCGRLCFDVNLLASGLPAGSARLGIVITSGTQRATFRTTPIADGSGWRRFCAPISFTTNGAPPQSGDGEWVLGAGTSWNDVIANVLSLELPIDLVSTNAEHIQFDNVCFHADPPPARPAIIGSTGVCGPAATFCVTRRQSVNSIITWSGTDVELTPATGPCTTVSVTGPSPAITATATRNGCSVSTTQQLSGCPSSISCATPSFSLQSLTITPDGADELESQAVLHVPGAYERITATLVSATVRSRDDCDGTFPLSAYLVDPQTIGGLTPLSGTPSPREITWTGGTAALVPLVVRIRGTQVGLPDDCKEELTFCFRYRVTGRDCVPCEQTICRTVVRP